jgi:SAM-dependent methyltransferase
MMDNLLALLVCPACRDGELLGLDKPDPDRTLVCSSCGAEYRVEDGIPLLLPPGSDPHKAHDELDHAAHHKQRQAGYFDRGVAEEFELTRPHGTPRAYRWLLTRKLLHSINGLPSLAAGATVVDACSGSGMEAEFLARQGARVVAIDISEGAVRRARARARRFGLDYLPVVGDVERLPIRSRAADVGFVHDGLHHLDDPMTGILELARVARRALTVNEPADAVVTQVAALAGLSANVEEAGNAVRRLQPEHVRQELKAAGWRVRFDRYLMYYGHEPGRIMEWVSRPGVFPVYQQLVETANLAVGRWGNKLCLVGTRNPAWPMADHL